MENKDVGDEEIEYDEVKDESDIDLSVPFSDLCTSKNNTKPYKDDDIIQFNDIKTILLVSFQKIQNLFIRFQMKLKEYEAVSEYYEVKNINLLPSMKWQTLSDLEVQSKLPIVHDNFEDTFMKIIMNMRVMDNAVVRLRYDNEKLADVLKLEENNQKKNKGEYKLDSKDLQYQSEISSNKILINDLKDDIIVLEEKCKKLNQKLKKAKEDVNKELEENNKLQEKCEKITKEKKKITKKLADEYDKAQFKDLTTIVQQNKFILKEIQDTKSKINEHKDAIEGAFLNNPVKKIDLLIESLIEKDSHVKNELRFALKEFKVLGYEMKDFFERINQNQDRDLDVLRQKIEILKEDLVRQDEQLHEQNGDLIEKEEELNTKIRSQNMIIIEKDNALLAIREKYLNEYHARFNFQEKEENYIKQIELLKCEITKLKEDAKNQCKNAEDLQKDIATLKATLEKKQKALIIMKEKIEKFNISKNLAEVTISREKTEKYEKVKKSLEERASMKEKNKICEEPDAEFNNMNITDIQDESEVE